MVTAIDLLERRLRWETVAVKVWKRETVAGDLVAPSRYFLSCSICASNPSLPSLHTTLTFPVFNHVSQPWEAAFVRKSRSKPEAIRKLTLPEYGSYHHTPVRTISCLNAVKQPLCQGWQPGDQGKQGHTYSMRSTNPDDGLSSRE